MNPASPLRAFILAAVVSFIASAPAPADSNAVNTAASPAAFEITCKEPGTCTATNQDGRVVLVIRGGRGIGQASVRPGPDGWPKEVLLRVHLRGLESLTLSAGESKLAASVSSQSGNERRLHLWKNGKESPPLTKDSPYWMEITTHDAQGRPVQGIPPAGGWFEMRLPPPLCPTTNGLTLAWINFYR
jgi:hypothetical protein